MILECKFYVQEHCRIYGSSHIGTVTLYKKGNIVTFFFQSQFLFFKQNFITDVTIKRG